MTMAARTLAASKALRCGDFKLYLPNFEIENLRIFGVSRNVATAALFVGLEETVAPGHGQVYIGAHYRLGFVWHALIIQGTRIRSPLKSLRKFLRNVSRRGRAIKGILRLTYRSVKVLFPPALMEL